MDKNQNFEIPKEYGNYKFSEDDKLRLKEGKTILVKNIVIDNQLKDAEFQINMNSKPPKMGVKFKMDKLNIGKEYLGKKLSPEEIKALEKGQEITIEKFPNKFILKVDDNLNRVVVKNQSEIKKLDMVGNYKLNENDQLKLKEGKELKTKVFKSPSGQYFTANLSLSDDKKGIQFTNIKAVSKDLANELIEKLNVDQNTKAELSNEKGLENAIDNNISNEVAQTGVNSIDYKQQFVIDIQECIIREDIVKNDKQYAEYHVEENKFRVVYFKDYQISPNEKDAITKEVFKDFGLDAEKTIKHTVDKQNQIDNLKTYVKDNCIDINSNGNSIKENALTDFCRNSTILDSQERTKMLNEIFESYEVADYKNTVEKIETSIVSNKTKNVSITM